jgi:hypothetical protein
MSKINIHIIKNPITGERLQVAESDFRITMDWSTAKKACRDLGFGWRLPNITELKLMYNELHKKGKGNFKSDFFYWSSTEDRTSRISIFSFRDETVNFTFDMGVYPDLYVRAVRRDF